MSASVPALANATADTQRYAVDLFALCGSDERIGPGIVEQVNLRCFPLRQFRGFSDWRLHRELRSLVKMSEVVHIHGVWRQHSLVGNKLASESGIPVVVSAHGMLEHWAVRNKWIKKAFYSALVERRNLQNAACLRALTTVEVQDYRRYGLRNPVVVIPNGITPPPDVTDGLFLDRYPELRSRRRVLFLSRVHYKKGLDPLCRAWVNLSQRFPDATLIIAGPDFERTQASVQTLVAELGIGRTVLFTGMLTGLLKWSAVRAADIFVLPSFSEGFSVAVLEALSMERPVVVTRQCNFPEIAATGCGLLIEPDAGEIENALVDLLRAPSRRLAEMGRRGRTLVDSRYSWKAIGNQMADVYDWLLGGQKPSSVELHD